MLGTRAVDEVRRHKEALLLESSLNRLKLQAELQNLRGLIRPMGGLAGNTRRLFPWLMLLAPVAGFFSTRGSRRSGSLTGKIASAAKLIVPVYRFWQRFS